MAKHSSGYSHPCGQSSSRYCSRLGMEARDHPLMYHAKPRRQRPSTICSQSYPPPRQSPIGVMDGTTEPSHIRSAPRDSSILTCLLSASGKTPSGMEQSADDSMEDLNSKRRSPNAKTISCGITRQGATEKAHRLTLCHIDESALPRKACHAR